MGIGFYSMFLFFFLSCVFLDAVWARTGVHPEHVNTRPGNNAQFEGVNLLLENIDHPEEKSDQKEGENLDEPIPQEEENPVCPDCGRRRSLMQARLQTDEMKKLVIEDIKRQILRKLHLKAPPNITTPLGPLPIPLAIDEMSISDDGYASDTTKDIDDYYGRTERIIILPDDESGYECPSTRPYPAACMYFQLNSDLPHDLTSVELWVFREREKRHFHNQTLIATDLQLQDHHKQKHVKHIEAEIQTKFKGGWIKFDVKHLVKHWLHHLYFGLNGLEISCPSCGKGRNNHQLIANSGKHRPFLLLKTVEGSSRTRNKRSTNCDSSTTQCCRESLYVSFEEIGWDSWIVFPQGYMANYCRGSCNEDGAIPIFNHPHAQTIMKVSQKFGIIVCCTPTRMSAITMLYRDQADSLFFKSVPNLSVEACGCA